MSLSAIQDDASTMSTEDIINTISGWSANLPLKVTQEENIKINKTLGDFMMKLNNATFEA
jgi:hypothetical protein